MKILILSYYFPPHPGMGAMRVGRLADFLIRAGHDVRVVAAQNSIEGLYEPRDRSFAQVSYAKWLDVNFMPDQATRLKNWMLGRPHRAATLSPHDGSLIGGDRSVPNAPDVLSRLDKLYRLCLNIPDDKVGWLPFALWHGRQTARAFKPDVIYASSPSPTGLVVASWLSRHYSTPWVAEIRDRWADDPYEIRPPWRAALDGKLERSVLSSARGIVTVSQTWAQAYQERYDKPTAVIYNGFTPEDDESLRAGMPLGEKDSLRVVYTGAVYAGRDPTPLWQALQRMGAAAADIRIAFYGSPGAAIRAAAARHGVSESVQVQDHLSHDEALRRQRQADILLVLQWNSPSEAGNIPGKLFEYLGARRPILALGYEDGEMARILRERKAGPLANDPEAIAGQLQRWLDEKRKTGQIALLPEAVRAGVSRDEQFSKLEKFLLTAMSYQDGASKGRADSGKN